MKNSFWIPPMTLMLSMNTADGKISRPLSTSIPVIPDISLIRTISPLMRTASRSVRCPMFPKLIQHIRMIRKNQYFFHPNVSTLPSHNDAITELFSSMKLSSLLHVPDQHFVRFRLPQLRRFAAPLQWSLKSTSHLT